MATKAPSHQNPPNGCSENSIFGEISCFCALVAKNTFLSL